MVEGPQFINFLRGYINTGTGVILTLAVFIGFIQTVFQLIPNKFLSEFVLLVLLGIVIISHHRDWEDRVRAEISIDLIGEKEQSDVHVKNKSLNAEISEGRDRVKHNHTITSVTEEVSVDKYVALIVTDRSLDWNDLDINPEGCELKEYGRLPRGGKITFPIELELPQDVTPLTYPATHRLSYSVDYDTLNSESDWVSTLIREPTDHIAMSVTFPEESEPENPSAYEIHDGSSSLSNIEVIVRQLPCGDWLLNWQRGDVDLGTEYVVTWGNFDIEELIS